MAVLRTSWERLESASHRCPLKVRLGHPLGITFRSPLDVTLGRLWDGRIKCLENFGGGRPWDVLGTNICLLGSNLGHVRNSGNLFAILIFF